MRPQPTRRKARLALAVLLLATASAACSTGSAKPTPGAATEGSVVPIPPEAPSAAAASPALSPPTAPGSAASAPTSVGAEAQRLQTELAGVKSRLLQREAAQRALRQTLAVQADAYYRATGAISARLQSGTTPGNPELFAEWSKAEAALREMDAETVKLVQLSAGTAQDAVLAGYLGDSAKRARALQGGVDADRARLDAVRTDAETVERQLHAEALLASADIRRQGTNLAAARDGLFRLASAIEVGELYAATTRHPRPSAKRPPPAKPGPIKGAPAISRNLPGAGGARPMAVIRFTQPDVAYDAQIRRAATEALGRKPSVVFDVVAYAAGDPKDGGGREEMETRGKGVVQSLLKAGVPAEQVSFTMSAETLPEPEIRIFVR